MKLKVPYRIIAWILSLLVVAACSGPDGRVLQPIPALDLDGMSPAIRDQFDAAIGELEAGSDDPDANGRLGMLCDAYSRFEEAEVLYSRARFFEPDSFRWTYLHGLSLAALRQNEKAIAALDQALEMRRGYPGAQLALAGLVYAEGDTARASGLYRQLIHRNPGLAQARFEYGKLLFEQGDAEAAVQSLQSALHLGNRYGKAHYTLSQAYRELGEAEKAATHLQLFERFRLFEPQPNDSMRQQVTALDISESRKEQRALRLSAQGNQRAAATLLQELAAAGSVSAHINLIAVYGEMGQFDKAQEHADIALSIDPDSVELQDNIGILYLKQNRREEAMNAFRAAMDIDPANAVPYKNLGAVLELKGDLDGAIVNFRRAVELDPYDRQARFLLAKALLQTNQPDEVIGLMKVITEYPGPNDALHWQLLGLAYERQLDYESAADAFRRAVVAAQGRGMADIAQQASAQLQRVRRRLP